MFNFYRLESQIEEEYLNSLRQACYREKSYSKFYVKSIAMIYLQCFDEINCLINRYHSLKIYKFYCHVFIFSRKSNFPSNLSKRNFSWNCTVHVVFHISQDLTKSKRLNDPCHKSSYTYDLTNWDDSANLAIKSVCMHESTNLIWLDI